MTPEAQRSWTKLTIVLTSSNLLTTMKSADFPSSHDNTMMSSIIHAESP
jgi:hypothetical protein